MRQILFLSTLILLGCAATQWTSEYLSEDAESYQASKVLVVGLSEDVELRKSFETQMVRLLERRSLDAVRSSDFFEQNFNDQYHTESELDSLEYQLLETGFDVILLTKVVGSQEKVNTMDDVRDAGEFYDTFTEDYYQSQDRYRYEQEPVAYTEYYVQSSVYCICPDKPRELLWSATSTQVESNKSEQAVKQYSKLLVERLEELSLLVD